MNRGSEKQSKHQSQKLKCSSGDEDNEQSKVVPFSNEHVEILTDKDHKLMNLKGLHKELNVSYDFVKEMKVMGFELPIAGMTTLTHAIKWLNANPNFREDARLLKLAKIPKRFSHPRHQAVDKSD